MSDNDFAKLLEESEQTALHSGQIVKGIIHQITDDTVFVDVGYKSEGKISRSEFMEAPNIGDELDVYIVSLEDYSGNIIVSKERAENIINKEKLDESFSSHTPIKGKVISLTETKSADKKGGFIVDIGIGKEVFCPYSQIDIDRVTDNNEKSYIGKTFDFLVTTIDKRNNKIVISRRALLSKQKHDAVESFFSTVQVGDVFKGVVKNIIKSGVFIELQPFVDGFCHISELNYERVKKPEDVISIDEEVDVKVIKIDKVHNKVDISIKALKTDPWIEFAKNHFEGDSIEGQVKDFVNGGAIISIEYGVDGFVPTSEISWVKKVKNPQDLLSIGQNIQAQIININAENRRLTLGLRQLLDNPWEKIEKKFPVGYKTKGKITNVTRFGIFVELEDGIEGLLHKNDISWNPEKAEMKDFARGQELEVMVISFNKKDQTISLGLKQLEDNPWQKFISAHPRGSSVKGTVKSLDKMGAVISLGEEIEGYLHISEVSKNRIEDISQVYKEGDEIDVLIVDANLKKNNISLSVKALEKKHMDEEIKKYTKGEESTKATLGDLFDFSKINIKK